MRKRRLAVAIATGAILLLLGRAFVFLYTDFVWYDSLAAAPVWREKTLDQLLLLSGGGTAAFLFAFANLSAVRHSVVSLVLPRRIANVEFGEAVPGRWLDAVALALSAAVAIATTAALPSWTLLSRARTGAQFGEFDPYHQVDLAFYTSWLPLETGLHAWFIVVVAVVAVLVVGLYALTPSLRWSGGMLRVSGYVRRHLGVLAAVVLLMVAWRFRLESYALLSDGTGPDGAFTGVDERWVLPWYLGLVMITAAAAAVVGWSTWTGHLTTAFVILTIVLVLIAGVQIWRPIAARSNAAKGAYAATRAAFTARAFSSEEGSAPDSAVAGSPEAGDGAGAGAGAAELDRAVIAAETRALVAPGASGYVVISGLGRSIAAPSVASLFSRIAHAWREQNGRVLNADLPRDPRIVRVRDLYDRVHRLAPVFSVLERHEALFHMDTLYWVVPVYASSGLYPLAERRVIGDTLRTYFREVAKAYVHSVTGRVTFVMTEPVEPLGAAWRRRFPSAFRPPADAAAWTRELTPLPRRIVPSPDAAGDDQFRGEVRRLYLRMQEALARADLAAFGYAFDSLGLLLQGRRR